MKPFAKISLFSIAITLLAVLAFTPADEEAAIRAVIEKEMDLLANKDLEAWKACFKHDAHTVHCGASIYEQFVYQGWDTILRKEENFLQAMPGAVKFKVERSNWNIRQSGNIAYATFDQLLTFENWPGNNPTKEIRCLEKIDGAWRIAVLSWTEKTRLDTEIQKAAIRGVIEAETKAYFDHDYEAWAAQWSQSPSAFATTNAEDGSIAHFSGFSAFSTAIKEGFTSARSTYNIRRDNWHFAISGAQAAVSFDQYFTGEDGKTYSSKEYRVMVWVGDRWKIAQVNAFWDYKNAK